MHSRLEVVFVNLSFYFQYSYHHLGTFEGQEEEFDGAQPVKAKHTLMELEEEVELKHVREAKRRARLAGRTTLGCYDFPPHIPAHVADAWIRRDIDRERSAEQQLAEIKRQRLASSSLPFSIYGDFFAFAPRNFTDRN